MFIQMCTCMCGICAYICAFSVMYMSSADMHICIHMCVSLVCTCMQIYVFVYRGIHHSSQEIDSTDAVSPFSPFIPSNC